MTRAAATLAALALAGCAHQRGPWVAVGAPWDVQAWADAAVAVTGDRKELLARGGEVRVATGPYALDGRCFVEPGWHVAGCSGPGLVEVLVWPERGIGPAPERTALAHELCHLGLEHGGGFSGPVVGATEAEADACARLVTLEVTR